MENRESLSEIVRIVEANDECRTHLRAHVERWMNENGTPSGNGYVVFRGVCDEQAIDVRHRQLNGLGCLICHDEPLSYSVTRGAANAHAAKGHVHGAVYSIEVCLDQCLMCEIEEDTSTDNLRVEKEVVILKVSPEVEAMVLEPLVVPRPAFRNNKHRHEYSERKNQLENIENEITRGLTNSTD